MKKRTETSIGRARAAFVFGSGDDARAVISTVVAHASNDPDGKRLRFTGSVAFEASTINHTLSVVMPIVDRILDVSPRSPRYFDISAVNPGAASVTDRGANISGFSADIPEFVAILSAGLQMPVHQDIVSTGHIASPDGDIALVKAIPAKIAAAAADKSIHHFVYPAEDRDVSLNTLTPTERQRVADAVVEAKSKIQVTAVTNIAELMRAMFPDEIVVLASLQQGFFHPSSTIGLHPVGETVRFLTEGNEERFWIVLERYLLAGQSKEAKELLQARVQFHITQQTYPQDFGSQLLRLIQSLPPVTRRLKVAFPLVPIESCVDLSQLAGKVNHQDVMLLYDAASGRRVSSHEPTMASDHSPAAPQCCSESNTLDLILSEISEEALTQTVGLPIDAARASYHMGSVTVNSPEEFNDGTAAFYLHMIRHLGLVRTFVDMNLILGDALDLLEKTFARQGGYKAALAEATRPVRGGMRYVLDAMTQQFKSAQQEKHITATFKRAMDSLDWNAQTNLMKAILQRLGPLLPEEIRSQPAEYFAKNYELVVRSYARSLDEVKGTLRAI